MRSPCYFNRLLGSAQLIIGMLICVILSPWISDATAKQITFAWDPNTEPNLGGYRLHYGPVSRSYNSVIDVGNQTRYTVFDLDDNQTYYFAVTAYTINDTFESGYSNEVHTGGDSALLASQESPSEGSYESGIGLIRGWVCGASTVEMEIDGGERLKAAYGTRRTDTETVCGTADTGYGLTYNWNALGDGIHTLRALADGTEFSRVNFYVTTLGETYLQGISGEYPLPDFPQSGSETVVGWSEVHQNFVIVGSHTESGIVNQNGVEAGEATAVLAHQESPSEGSYESGIGLIRGWVCNASTVEVEIDGGERLKAAHGTSRPDTASLCGTADTGYGLIYNWNTLGDGVHSLRALADGVEFAKIVFTVTTLGQEYLRDVPAYERILSNFPSTGKETTVRWSEPHQNFMIVGFH